jgi:uncharacterized circularly permuted ATP-grasp superfamily protein
MANPSGYAQPTPELVDLPAYVDGSVLAPRHIDLRPYVLSGREVQMV